jgi:hypothetical protein
MVTVAAPAVADGATPSVGVTTVIGILPSQDSPPWRDNTRVAAFDRFRFLICSAPALAIASRHHNRCSGLSIPGGVGSGYARSTTSAATDIAVLHLMTSMSSPL